MIQFTLADLARKLGGELRGSGDVVVRQVCGIGGEAPDALVYVAEVRLVEEADRGSGIALLVPEQAPPCRKPAIVVKNPRLALARLLIWFQPEAKPLAWIHPTAVIHPSALLGNEVLVDAFALVGPGARIGDRVRIGPHVVIEEGVVVGEDTILRARVTLLKRVQVGKRCVLYEGAIIGSEGFGYVPDETGKPLHIPQIGTVILEDDVEIGSNSTIDRGTLGATRIGAGTKLDNLVHVAHNCDIGKACLIAALAGIAGSVKIGDQVVFGGHVGIKDHVEIGEGAIIAGGSMVWGNIDPKAFVSGTPARPHKEHLRASAALQRVPDLITRVKALEKGKDKT